MISPKNQTLKLTTAIARALPLPEAGEYSVQSAEHQVLGLQLRVRASGRKVWVIKKHVRGQVKTVTLGVLAGTGKGNDQGLTLDQAVTLANQRYADLMAGKDPVAEKRQATAQATESAAKRKVTVKVAFDEYLEAWEKKAADGKRGGSQKTRDGLLQAKRLIESGPVWSKPILSLTGEMLDTEYGRLLKLATRGTGLAQATNTFRWLRAAVFEAAGKKTRGWRITAFDDLTERREDWNARRTRTTIVGQTHGDLAKWWQAVDKLRTRIMYPESAAATADLLLLTLFFGNRKKELLTVRWEKVDFDRRLITLFASKAKRDRKNHVLPFGRYAHAILRRRWEAYQQLPIERQSGYVFWSERAHQDGSYSHLQEPKKGVAQVAAESDTNATMHDLRRSVGSFLTEMDVSEAMLKKVLNHAPENVADAHYVITRLEPFRAIFQRLEDKVLKEAGVEQLPPDEFSGDMYQQQSIQDMLQAMLQQFQQNTPTPPPSPAESPPLAASSYPPARRISLRKSGDVFIASTTHQGEILEVEGATPGEAKALLAELLA